MSSLTRCNFCALLTIRRNAAERGLLVELVRRSHSPDCDALDVGPDRIQKPCNCIGGGTDVLVNGVLKAWMQEITDQCVC